MQSLLAIFFVLIWIALPTSSNAGRVLDSATENPNFGLFDYGDVDENAQTYHDITQDAFLEEWSAKTNQFNVIDFGAVGNGIADDSQAFLKAWSQVCGSTRGTRGIPTLIVPKGKTFLLKSVFFRGPCKARNVNFQIQGIIVAPTYFGSWAADDRDKWIQFMKIQGLIINGGGQIDGHGAVWWNGCRAGRREACQRPTTLHVHKCDGLQLSRLTFLNSPRNHISISSTDGVQVSGLLIRAPKESPNTDGIDISGSTNVVIQSSRIETGDDCIAINSGTSFVNITGVLCGPGHGISIGSLGEHGEYSTVEEVHVSNCSFRGTQNGVRIKTWEGGSGYARKITFEGISFTNTENPIIIDQHYFANPMPAGVLDLTKCVQVSDVTYKDIYGSSVDEKAINLDCGRSGGGCTNIVLDNVHLTPADPSKKTYAYCNNAHGTATLATPHVPCLAP